MVHDLATFNALRSCLASRLETARRLLEELTSISIGEPSSSTSMRSVVEKFAAELGDGLMKVMEADGELLAALSIGSVKMEAEEASKPLAEETEENKKEDEEESKALKNPKKRRRTSFLVSVQSRSFV